MKKALIVQGGWDGHEPKLVSTRIANTLREEGFEVEVFDTLEPFEDADKLNELDLIVPCWTMGTISNVQAKNVVLAVANGVGIAGCHGGMCDAFRNNVDWQFMTGGNWVAHPGNNKITYTVDIASNTSPLVEGIESFEVTSEQYYLHVDPAIEVLATTRFPIAPGYHTANKPVDMPVVWTKMWGKGRVFYTSLGHVDAVFANVPQSYEILRRGMLWAAESKNVANNKDFNAGKFENSLQ